MPQDEDGYAVGKGVICIVRKSFSVNGGTHNSDLLLQSAAGGEKERRSERRLALLVSVFFLADMLQRETFRLDKTFHLIMYPGEQTYIN